MTEEKNQKPLLKKLNAGALLIALLAFILGWQLGHRDYSLSWKNYTPQIKVTNQQPPQNIDIDFTLFWQTWDLLSKEYVDKKALDPQKMYYGAIQGMVASLGDPYTVFLPPQSQKSVKEELGGSFEGVGMELGYNKEKRLVVIAPLKDTPAEKGGIRAGDMILKIDGKDTTNLTLPDAVNSIRGTKGSKVMLQIYHEGDKNPTDVTLERDTIIVKSVDLTTKTTKDGKKVAVVKLSRFGEKTVDEWNKVVSQILADNPSGVILDLRNNPGGFLDDAVYIGSEFVSSGNIVMQEDGQGVRKNYAVTRTGKLLSIPMVVLVNKGSASASEIVAGAIQDHKRGTLVGEQSFGKGTIQEAQDLPGGTGIHVTTAKWLTPDGRWVHNTGLTPDVVVAFGDDPTKDLQLEKALELLNK
jgi:carboxyl-terminal processing protease